MAVLSTLITITGRRIGINGERWLHRTTGWFFEPNYRGSSAYGDRFALEISPKLVSVPGVDILAGVDALVKDGTADPERLAIGGYSYGGYMTNWLLTQTTRFKAAVTGAGAVSTPTIGATMISVTTMLVLGRRAVGEPQELPGRGRLGPNE